MAKPGWGLSGASQAVLHRLAKNESVSLVSPAGALERGEHLPSLEMFLEYEHAARAASRADPATPAASMPPFPEHALHAMAAKPRPGGELLRVFEDAEQLAHNAGRLQGTPCSRAMERTAVHSILEQPTDGLELPAQRLPRDLHKSMALQANCLVNAHNTLKPEKKIVKRDQNVACLPALQSDGSRGQKMREFPKLTGRVRTSTKGARMWPGLSAQDFEVAEDMLTAVTKIKA